MQAKDTARQQRERRRPDSEPPEQPEYAKSHDHATEQAAQPPSDEGEGALDYDALWSRHSAEWRDTAQIASQWSEAADTDPALLSFTYGGAWWDVLAECGITLIVTREYEHLLMAIACPDGRPLTSFMRMPHPSGLAVDRQAGRVHVASTRNPNQVFDLMPVVDMTPRLDVSVEAVPERPLVPVLSRFFPGCLYMHDLAFVAGELHANAVGQNAIVRLNADGSYDRLWWPRCIETAGGIIFGQNHIQLNSIAAGDSLEKSYFSASSAEIESLRPGHPDYPVDGRGVIFSGETREPIARGLTRPHSARLHEGSLWVDNSGYGELGLAEGGRFVTVSRLPGWTRGLCFYGQVVFVGTSRVIPRFRQYAPGLDVDESVCAVHAVDCRTGKVLGSLSWPSGNQIFAIDWVPAAITTGFPFASTRLTDREKLLFYAFSAHGPKEDSNER